ncbi:MAG: outer membrane lipoprotein carrier protein LolA [Saprospiraceae bacterium]|nr:outer membrane lipoprotein carrier protein LolA [Saprospiraceae bacterium]
MKFLRKLLIPLFILAPLSISTLIAQPMAVKTDMTDAKAKSILDKVKKQYDGYSSLESNFKVEYKLAEQPKPNVMTGKVYQQGESFRAEMGKDFAMSNGRILWQKSGNAVQIKNANSKDANDLMTPKTLMRMYEKNEFSFGITGESAEGWSKKAIILTGKPNKRSEFTKIVIAIDQKTNHIVSVTAFERDQSRSKVILEPPVLNQKYADTMFNFDKSKYPGVKIQDLRVD